MTAPTHPRRHLTGVERVREFELYAAAIRARMPVVRGEAFPDQHEPFGWELEPEPFPTWKE